MGEEAPYQVEILRQEKGQVLSEDRSPKRCFGGTEAEDSRSCSLVV